jgi:hypothetical protein
MQKFLLKTGANGNVFYHAANQGAAVCNRRFIGRRFQTAAP